MILTLIDQFIISASNFITNIIVARNLGLNEFGMFSIILLVTQFIWNQQMSLIIAPMMSIGPKQHKDLKKRYYGSVLIFQIAFTLLISLSFILVSQIISILHINFFQQDLILPIVLLISTFLMQEFIRKYFFVNGLARKAILIDTISYIGQVLILSYFVSLYHETINLRNVIYFISISSGFSIIIGVLIIEKLEINKFSLKDSFQKNFEFSKWLFLSQLLHWISGNFWTISVSVIMGASSTGALRATQNIIGVLNIILLGLENIIPVKAAHHLAKGGKEKLFSYIKKFTLVGSIFTLIFCVLIAVFSEHILNLVYGDKYVNYAFLLRGLTFFYFLCFLNNSSKFLLRALELTREIFLANLISFTFIIPAFYPLIKYYQFWGFIIGLVVVQLIQQLYYVIIFKRI